MVSNGAVGTDRDALGVIDELVEQPNTTDLVRAFYNPQFANELSDRADFVGELFVTLGDTPSDSFEADDLLAVHLTGMTFRVSTTKALLEPGKERDKVCCLLSEIPNDVDIWDANEEMSSANKLWERLVGSRYPGVGWVTAGKLLARKRPRLIPVIDSVIEKRVPLPDNHYWSLFQNYLRSEGSKEKVESLRPEGLSASSTSTLRLLDTAIWCTEAEARQWRSGAVSACPTNGFSA